MTFFAFRRLLKHHALMASHALRMIGSDEPWPLRFHRVKVDRVAVPAVRRLILLGLSFSAALMMASVTDCLQLCMEICSHLAVIGSLDESLDNLHMRKL